MGLNSDKTMVKVWMASMQNFSQSAIKDNQGRGKVGDFLKDGLKSGSMLSFVSAYFTIYAFEQLKKQILKIDHLNFLFGELHFLKSLDPDKTDKKSFKIGA